MRRLGARGSVTSDRPATELFGPRGEEKHSVAQQCEEKEDEEEQCAEEDARRKRMRRSSTARTRRMRRRSSRRGRRTCSVSECLLLEELRRFSEGFRTFSK